MSSSKSTQGYLELYHKSKKWKSYLFKITGSTYFHYFGRKSSKAKKEVFLMAITDVVIPQSPPKGGKYVFEVKLSGRGGSWILNAPSEEERLKWMEALYPGCISPKKTQPSSSEKPDNVFYGRHQSNENLYSQPLTASYNGPQQNSTQGGYYYHSPPPPAGYVGTALPQQSSQSSINGGYYQFDCTPPQNPGLASLPPYANIPTPAQTQTSPIYLQQLSNTSRSPPFSPTSSLSSVNSLSSQVQTNPGDENRVKSPTPCEDTDVFGYLKMYSPTSSPPPSPAPVATTNIEGYDATILSQQFTQDQVEMLIQIFQKVKTYETRESSHPASPTKTKREQLDLGYLMQQTAGSLTDSILASESDTSTSNSRPKWATAVNEEKALTSSFEFFDHRIPKSCLFNAVSIGSGNFGDVFRAIYIPEGGEAINVAIKTIKSDQCSEAHKKEMLREFSVMASMIHPNIVQLYGVVIEDVPTPWIVLEFFPYGDLKSYLKKNPQKPVGTLVKYMVDIAMGMHYLAQCGLIHRDLAARNVLVGEGELCKVSDFGLLREIPTDTGIYQSQTNLPLPIRWMPPESITERAFSVSSDVWSFGILQWELFNPNSVPYSGMDNNQLIIEVSQGYRLPVPERCPPVVAKVMKACWHKDPKMRPSFLVITSLLTTKGHATL